MASRLNPYLSCKDNAREMMEFYRSVLGGELEIMTFGQMGGTPEDGVMHAMLSTPSGFTLMASDTPPGMDWEDGYVNVTLSLSGDDVDDLRGWFAGLAEGGTVRMPLEKQMWGDEFGMLTDRYGVGWMVNIAGDAVA